MKALFKIIILLLSPFLLAQNTNQLDSLLIEGIKARNNKNFVKSLEFLTKVRTIAEENKWYKQQFLAINNIGANYYAMLDYGEALDNYLEAYNIALKYLDDNEEMIVLNNIAILFSKEGELNKAKEYFLKAYKLAHKKEDTIKIGLYAINLGIVANNQDKLELANTYLQEAKKQLKNEPSIYILAEIALAENLYKKNELLKAKYLATTILPNLETTALSEERINILLLLSNIANNMDEKSEAIELGKTALNLAINLETKITAFKQLSKIYLNNQLYIEALNAKDSILNLTDSLYKLKNGKLFETNKVKFEISNYRRELKQNKELQEQERIKLYSLLGISILIIFLIAWALYNSAIKNRQRKILHQRSKEFIELELEKKESDNLLLEKQLIANETDALLKEERLKNEIETRNRKLAAKALQISGRNELINDIINNLTDQSDISKNTFLTNKINELKKLLNNDSEWNTFLTHFEEVNNGLLSKLHSHHPGLTANDIRYLSYVYMGLTTKEIASLINITIEAARKRKERIIKKMGLKANISLYNYITEQ
ncbi:tetratricopeptide repeat protein [Formosa maritima]|uniref:Tetratricopeptide repeat protein n=1 Tax=Formosa maritima TaxID=2592046 RepID=A0A5D0G9V7_9FLAO|nr:tetratricopeptide repeat protein [Formosa maritima]TYA55726.1 tetratricopeptide repeat protein [Formosa maritima]